MSRILLIGLILLTVIGCSTATLKVGYTKEKSMLQLKREPDVKHKISEYELWCIVTESEVWPSYTDLYILKNDIIIYHRLCHRLKLNGAKYFMTDWVDNTHQPDLQGDIEAILNNKIRVGMREMPVLFSWGFPNDMNETVGSWGKHEQWVYGEISSGARILYFENGILTSWQNIGK